MKGVMKMKQLKIYVIAFILFVNMAGVCAQDWPQYLGPKETAHRTRKVFYAHGLSRDRKFYGPLM